MLERTTVTSEWEYHSDDAEREFEFLKFDEFEHHAINTNADLSKRTAWLKKAAKVKLTWRKEIQNSFPSYYQAWFRRTHWPVICHCRALNIVTVLLGFCFRGSVTIRYNRALLAFEMFDQKVWSKCVRSASRTEEFSWALTWILSQQKIPSNQKDFEHSPALGTRPSNRTWPKIVIKESLLAKEFFLLRAV